MVGKKPFNYVTSEVTLSLQTPKYLYPITLPQSNPATKTGDQGTN